MNDEFPTNIFTRWKKNYIRSTQLNKSWMPKMVEVPIQMIDSRVDVIEILNCGARQISKEDRNMQTVLQVMGRSTYTQHILHD